MNEIMLTIGVFSRLHAKTATYNIFRFYKRGVTYKYMQEDKGGEEGRGGKGGEGEGKGEEMREKRRWEKRGDERRGKESWFVPKNFINFEQKIIISITKTWTKLTFLIKSSSKLLFQKLHCLLWMSFWCSFTAAKKQKLQLILSVTNVA